MILIDSKTVEELLPISECIPLMRGAMKRLGSGETLQPLRSVLQIPGESKFLGLMPGYAPHGETGLGAKIISVFPNNFDKGLPSHQGVIILFNNQTGAVSAIVDAQSVTAIRTAAISAVATDVAANPEAKILTLIGYGEQAWRHAQAIPKVRNIEAIIVTGRDAMRAKAFGDRLASVFDGEIRIEEEIEAAVKQGEIICTLTHAREPILRGEWLTPGAHVNAVGASTLGFREVDEICIKRSRFFGDYSDGIRAHSQEFLSAVQSGAVTAGSLLGGLGDALNGRLVIRSCSEDITCFKSLGNVVQDLSAAAHVFARVMPRTSK